METLRIRLFGGVELTYASEPIAPLPSHKSRSLLAYLVLNRDRVLHRETLCGLIWPDDSEAVARKGLRTALWRIRSAIEPDSGVGFLHADAFHVGFRSEGAWADAWEFEDCVDALASKHDDDLDAADAERLAKAAALYRGDLAAGHYEDWCLAEQERFRLAHLTMMERLVGYHRRRRNWLQAIVWAQQVLARDPLREHLHRAIMGCHMLIGDRPSALRQYRRCETALRDELGIAPMAETLAIRDQISRGAAKPSERDLPEPGTGPAASGMRNLVDDIDRAMALLQAVSRKLEDIHRPAGETGTGRRRDGSETRGD